MKWQYYILEWSIPWESEDEEERDYAFCSDGKIVEQFRGMDRRQLQQVFDMLGEQGWELVHPYEWRKFFFKRRVAD